MSTDEHDLIQNAFARGYHPRAWKRYLDWLETFLHHDKAAFIRTRLQLRSLCPHHPEWFTLQNQRASLSARLPKLWRLSVRGTVELAVSRIVPNVAAYFDIDDRHEGQWHIRDMPGGRSGMSPCRLELGQRIQMRLRRWPRTPHSYALSWVRTELSPWRCAAHRLSVGDEVVGRVVSLIDYGAFVELVGVPSVQGLMHLSEIQSRYPERHITHAHQWARVGHIVRVIIRNINVHCERLTLAPARGRGLPL